MLPSRILYILLFFVVSLAILPTNNLHAQELEIKDCVMAKKQGSILINFGVELRNAQELNEYLSEGSPLKLICTGKLFKDRSFWLDKKLKEKKLIFELDYNPLTQKYTLSNSNIKNSTQSQSLKKLFEKYWKELELDLGNWNSIPQGSDYTFQLEVELKRGKVPGWMKVVLFFWSWDKLSSKTYEMDFSY